MLVLGFEVLSMIKSIALVGLVAVSAHWFHRFLLWVWIKPKRLEKILRDQGFRGNNYIPFLGDQYESERLIRDALSRPIGIDDDLNKRIIPHIYKHVEKYGKKSYMWVGRIPRVLVTDPEHVKEIFTKNYLFQKNHIDFDPITKLQLTGVGSLEGKTWLARRKQLNPAFYYEKLKLLPLLGRTTSKSGSQRAFQRLGKNEEPLTMTTGVTFKLVSAVEFFMDLIVMARTCDCVFHYISHFVDLSNPRFSE